MSANLICLSGWLFQAISFYDEGHYSQSLKEISQVLTLQPVYPTALMRKGFILDKLAQTEETLSYLGQVKELFMKKLKNTENDSWIREVNKKAVKIEK